MERFLASVLALAGVAAAPAFAADGVAPGERITYTKHIQSIVQENCQICHRPGGDNVAGMVAPMSLTSYREVRPWAKSIARAVESRQMPPWDATDETHGQFVNERALTSDEIALILEWVEQSAVRGNPADAPASKVFENSSGWIIGEPDLYVRMPEPYWVADDVEDIQPNVAFTLTEEMLPEPRWISAIEYRPDSEVVHHIVGYATAPPIEGHDEERFNLGSIAAGEDPTVYPPGFGNLLRAGTKVRFSMHYHKEAGPGTGMWDQSGIGFKFHPKGVDVKHKVSWSPVNNNAFEIPPGVSNWLVGSARVFEKDTVLLSIHPHMHYRGVDSKMTAYYPDGTSELLLNVDRYEYAWQINYIYKNPKVLPAGTRVDVQMHYDNSKTIKTRVPKLNIERAVVYGAASTDEMNNQFLAWTYVEPEEAARIKAASEAAAAADSN